MNDYENCDIKSNADEVQKLRISENFETSEIKIEKDCIRVWTFHDYNFKILQRIIGEYIL